MTEEEAPKAPRPRGRMGSAVLPVSGVIVIALVARWIFGLLPGHGSSNAPPQSSVGTNATQVAPDGIRGTTQAPASRATPSSRPAYVQMTPSEPLQITVRGDQYVVNGTDISLQDIIASIANSKVNGVSAAVKIITLPDSRVGSEKALEDALKDAGVKPVVESRPATQP